MKRKRQGAKSPQSSAAEKGSTTAGLSTDAAPLQVRHKWLFRLLLAVIGPVVVLTLFEVALRVVGFGHPTSFFVQRQLGGKTVLVENASFGLSFFPPALARGAPPVVMEAEKPQGVYRIFLFGESAAMGDPRPAFGVGRYLETLLRERMAGEKFEVVCVAMTAINSHAIVPIARECAKYDGDLWIVYMGNNEFVGPFGASKVFGAPAPPLSWVRAYLALQRARVGQWMVALGRKLNASPSTPAKWEGMKMFEDQQVPPDDPRKQRIYANFRQNLEDILEAGRAAGVSIILSSVACNLKDCAPFASVHASSQKSIERGEFDSLYHAAITNAERSNIAEATRDSKEATKLSPNYAAAHFLLGQSMLSPTNFEAASRSFTRSRDLDALPFRADSQINSIIGEAARRHAREGVVFVDAEEAVAPTAEGRIAGEEYFCDHVHLNFEGNYRLARALAEKVLTNLPGSIAKLTNAAWAGPDLCARDLGLTDWNRSTILEEFARRLAEPPFNEQLNHRHQEERLAQELAECRRRQQPGAVEAARQVYVEALQKDPDEHWLHHNYAEFLAGIGDVAGATTQMRMVCSLTPENPAAFLQLGRLLARQHQFDEARESLEKALELRAEMADVHMELGQIRLAQGNLDEALREYAKARTSHQDDARAYLLEAEALEKHEKRSEAIAALREAIRLRPSYWEARDRLGMELGLLGKFSEAAAEFGQVVKLRPDFADGHLNLGIALARQGNLAAARDQFQATLRLEPGNGKARDFLARIEQAGDRGGAQGDTK